MDSKLYVLQNAQTDPDLFQLYNNAANDFLKKKFQTNMTLAFELKQMSPICDLLFEERQALKLLQAKKYGTLWLWLTISPKKTIIFEDFKKKIEKTANSKMFKDFYYVFEQRGKTNEEAGQGFHAHMLLMRNLDYKQSKVLYNLKQSYEKYSNVNDRNIFNFHWLHEEYFGDKVNYITGQNKDGEDKKEKQLIDVIFRQNYFLKEYYKKECLPSEENQNNPKKS